ncbi:MAG TPA: hypothetical protein ENK82_01790 [Campylobacterales bacterium]|nr:hypothetical protein [Campylobacterales bacterium]HHS92054.1 hypothetical protein [Campylobacterales bacterium]
MNKFYSSFIILFLTSTLFLNATTSLSSNSELIKIVKQQQYLAKKISKYYGDFQADKRNIKKKELMKKSIKSFHSNHLKLIKNRNNTQVINQKLTKVDKIWKIADKLSQTQKHDKMLNTAMNDISGEMEELKKLYTKITK